MVLFLSEAIAHDRWRLCLNDYSNINPKKLVENRYCCLHDIFEHAPILLATCKHTKADKGSQQEMRQLMRIVSPGQLTGNLGLDQQTIQALLELLKRRLDDRVDLRIVRCHFQGCIHQKTATTG